MRAIFTLKQLTDARACSGQVALFKETFGDSVNVTVARARKVADKFDWSFAVQFLDDEGKAEYKRVRGAALAEYKRVCGAALAEYKRVRGAALAEYQRVRDAAWAEYERVRDAALAEYKRVCGTAWASAYIATCARTKAKVAA